MTAAALPRPRPAPLEPLSAPAAPVLRALGADWRRLAAPAHPFLAPEWLALTARTLVPGEPFVVAARREGRLVAALALVRRGRVLHSLTSAHSPRYDLVGDPAALPLLFSLLRTDPRWDALVLELVPEGSPLLQALPLLAKRAGFRVERRPGPRSPWFALHGFAEKLSAKFRANLRRRARKLEGMAFERIALADPQALADGLALEAAGWKGQAGSGTAIACSPRLVRFYTALARTFARRGQLTLAFLRAAGRRIAFHFALEDDRTYYLLKPGYDPAFASAGPGQLLVREAAADAAARGLVEFDFLGWDMDWKREWTDEVRAHTTLCLYRPTVRGHLLHTAREVLPTRARMLFHKLAGGKGAPGRP